jgi:hypothetical protein
MIGPNRLEEITTKSSDDFWKSVSQQLPECNIENLNHGTIIYLQWQMKSAIERLIEESLKRKEQQ